MAGGVVNAVSEFIQEGNFGKLKKKKGGGGDFSAYLND